jgi:O-antigen/teichoic acid export membrane protein
MSTVERSGVSSPSDAPATPRSSLRLRTVVGRLTAVNILVAALGLLSAPLQARALGVAGRGELAAILVMLTVVPLVFFPGIGIFATRQAARGLPLGQLIGSLGAVAVAVGCLGFVVGPPIAALVAGGRDTVFAYVLAVFLLLPLLLVTNLLLSVHAGLQRWGAVIASRLIPAIGSTAAIVVLYIGGWLSVGTAALVAIVSVAAAILPLVVIVYEARPLSIKRSLIRESVPFGFKAWIASIGELANLRLDQLLMTRLVSARQLGLYAVAATIAGFSQLLTATVGPAIAPRVATGDREVVGRGLRVTLAFVCAASLPVAAITPVLLDVLFGSSFADAAPFVWILLVAGVPLAGVWVLGPALTTAGHPGPAARAEIASLTVTLIALLVLLPQIGALAGAIVSVLAYSLNFALLVVLARRVFGCSARQLLLVTRVDLAWASQVVRDRLARVRTRSRAVRG